MSTGINPTTVAVALPIIAKAMGFRLPGDRDEAVEYLNKYRELLYNLYEEKKLFTDAFHCICISTFKQRCADCRQGPRDSYQGFTLPEGVGAVEAVWEYGEPVTLRSRWREALAGIGAHGPTVETIEMAERFSTERDLQGVTPIKLFAENSNDSKLEVVVEVVDADWDTKKITYVLQGDTWVQSDVQVREILSVSLPLGRKGRVRIAQLDGYELSIYGPGEYAPCYRRFKLTSSCRERAVLVQGSRVYADVVEDSDIVEVGSRLVIEAAGRYFKYGETTLDPNEIKRANFDLNTLKEHLSGAQARDRGRSIQDGTPFRGRPLISYKKPLPGYRR